MKQQFATFLLRLVVTSIGIWLVVSLLGGVREGAQPTVLTYLGAGLAFSIVNSILKPIITILALPAIVLTLGLFIIVVNGLMVYLALLLVPSLKLTFFQAVIAGIILSVINYSISILLQTVPNRPQRHKKVI
jgi:putative membrane protein